MSLDWRKRQLSSKQARAEAKNTLLFDNGDLIQGNPLGDYKAKVDVLEEGETHPVFQAMELLDYDAATLRKP